MLVEPGPFCGERQHLLLYMNSRIKGCKRLLGSLYKQELSSLSISLEEDRSTGTSQGYLHSHGRLMSA